MTQVRMRVPRGAGAVVTQDVPPRTVVGTPVVQEF